MRRRSILGLPLLALAPAAAAAPAGLVIVLNSGDASISLLDPAGTELKRVPVLREPHHITLSPTGRDLLVGDCAGN